MTTVDQYTNSEGALNEIHKFEQDLKHTLKKNLTTQDLSRFVQDSVSKVYKQAIEQDQQGDDVKALETYFVCLGMLKQIIDQEAFNLEQDQHEVQRLLIQYDLPCSLKMCRILLESQNYDQAQHLAERALAIDPKNQEAHNFMKEIKNAQSTVEWEKLKRAQDMKSFFKDYSIRSQDQDHITPNSQSLVATQGEIDPAKVIPLSVEIIIKIVLLIPHAIFKKTIEPFMVVLYESFIYPFYSGILLHLPVISVIAQFQVSIFAKFLHLMANMLNFLSGKFYHDMSGAENHYKLSQHVGEDLKLLKAAVFKKLRRYC